MCRRPSRQHSLMDGVWGQGEKEAWGWGAPRVLVSAFGRKGASFPGRGGLGSEQRERLVLRLAAGLRSDGVMAEGGSNPLGPSGWLPCSLRLAAWLLHASQRACSAPTHACPALSCCLQGAEGPVCVCVGGEDGESRLRAAVMRPGPQSQRRDLDRGCQRPKPLFFQGLRLPWGLWEFSLQGGGAQSS